MLNSGWNLAMLNVLWVEKSRPRTAYGRSVRNYRYKDFYVGGN